MTRISDVELHKRALLRLQGINNRKPVIGPEVVQMHITNRCNLSCRYCYYHAPTSPLRDNKLKDMSLNKFKAIIRDCIELKVDKILFSGEGEPTLHPRFYDMLAYVEMLPLGVKILSNGTFPFRRCREIVRASLIRINMGEVERIPYRSLHGKDMFGKVIANIRELVRLRQKLNTGLRIEIVFVVNKFNVAAESKMKALGKELGVDSVRSVAEEISQYDGGNRTSAEGQTWMPCFMGWYNAFICLDGKLNICCYLKQVIIADLNKVSLKAAWWSKEFARARLMILSRKHKYLDTHCRGCPELEKNRRNALMMVGLKAK